MSLRRWPPQLSAASSLPVFSEESGGLQEFWGGDLLGFRWKHFALMSASSIVLSCSAKWHWASSWLDDGEAMARRGEEDSEGREMGREGQGMDMGALRLSLLGGEQEGLMLNEEPRRERRLPPCSRSFSFGRLIQDAITGMLCWRRTGPRRWGGNRGGGGRGGGNRGPDSADVLLFCLLLWVSLLRLCCSVLESPSRLEVLGLLLRRSSIWTWVTRWWGLGACSQASRWWILMKRGLMKQRAPFDWQQSSSDGGRTRSQGQPGVLSKETALWLGGGGLSGADTSDIVNELLVFFQKAAKHSHRNVFFIIS